MDTNTLPKTKKCSRCEKRKRLHLFVRNAQSSTGYGAWCKSCMADYSRETRVGERADQNRFYARTYSTALRLLKDQHEEEFDRILAEVRKAES